MSPFDLASRIMLRRSPRFTRIMLSTGSHRSKLSCRVKVICGSGVSTSLAEAFHISWPSIYEIDIFETKFGRSSKTQIPDGLCDAPGDEPTVRQDDLLEPSEDLMEPLVSPERDSQIVQRVRFRHL